MEEVLNQYHEDHDVKYTLMVEIDGELLAKYESNQSADDVSGYAGLLDNVVAEHIIQDVNEAAEYKAEAEAEAQMEAERGN